jgi:predicted RNase H-like nuclease (RuvC/YqgF family)
MTTLKARFNDAQCELMRYGKTIHIIREEFKALKRENRELERHNADLCGEYEDKNMERNAQIDYMNVEFNRMEKLIKELREEIKNKKTIKVLRVKIKKLKKTDWEVKYAKLYETYMIEKYAHEEKMIELGKN